MMNTTNTLSNLKKKNPLNLNKTLLVLDIDETLIHSSKNSLGIEHDFKIGNFYYVYTRPGLKEFISFALDNFNVAVWSSASFNYVEAMVNEIFPNPDKLKFYWASNRCTMRYSFEHQEWYDIKDLKKVGRIGYNKERILIVDDTPAKSERNYGNAIHMQPFTGDQNDRYLYMLVEYLKTIKDIKNVREIDKRVWWKEYQ